MGLSLQDRFALLPSEERQLWLATQPDYIVDEILRGEWWWVARPEQVPPDGGWLVCLALAGRGFGKSRAGAEWVIERVTKHPFDTTGTPTEWLVIAETLSDARTICMEGPAGILHVLERRKVKYRYKMSPRPMILFPNGSRIYTEGADDPDVGRGYNASGAWLDEVCIAEDEPIVTDHGLVPVQHVRVGDRVLTRGGWRPVSWAGITRRDAEVLEIRTTSGTVRLTPEHRVWANGRWVMARDIARGDTITSCNVPRTISFLNHYQQSTKSLKNRSQVTLQRFSLGMVIFGTTTNDGVTMQMLVDTPFIEQFGQQHMGQFHQDTKSTTRTVSRGIIESVILRYLPWRLIGNLHGSNAVKAREPQLSTHVGNENLFAQSVVFNSKLLTGKRYIAHDSVQWKVTADTQEIIVLNVVKVNNANVYDVTVDDEQFPEFFAGSGKILVHNCKWKYPKDSWYHGIMPSLRADLTMDHPRAFVTTTPKPLDLLQEWISRDDGTVHVIRGSTFDNARNLSPLVLEELRRRYEGTAIGMQELYGEIIDAFEGALFSRLDMENHRVDDTPDGIVATVVGVDPSLTGEDDEMGIVVVSRDTMKHMYIVADRSIMAVGRAAALEAWRVVAEYGADKMVVEENLGKRWMQQVFNDAYYELVGEGKFPKGTKPPLVRVDTKLGKRTRGEPVAMRSEQGRLHLVGRWPQLEDQMATFVSWGQRESPDRLDALVHACRFLMDGEKKETRITSPADALSTTLRDLFADAASYNF